MEVMEFWDGIKRKYKLGHRVIGVVEHHAPFGVFIDLGDPVVKGLVQVTDFLDEGVMWEEMYPPIGEEIEAVVLGYTEDARNQIWLGVKPSQLSNAPVD